MRRELARILKATFCRIKTHVNLVGMSNTDEATFRSFFMVELMRWLPSAKCQTEWHKFDLLAQANGRNVLVEFKYYISRRTTELDGKPGNWKGEAGTQNEREFWECVKKLQACTYRPVHLKLLLLVYEREYPRKSKYSFTGSYDSLSVGESISRVTLVDHAMSDQLTCKIVEIA